MCFLLAPVIEHLSFTVGWWMCRVWRKKAVFTSIDSTDVHLGLMSSKHKYYFVGFKRPVHTDNLWDKDYLHIQRFLMREKELEELAKKGSTTVMVECECHITIVILCQIQAIINKYTDKSSQDFRPTSKIELCHWLPISAKTYRH